MEGAMADQSDDHAEILALIHANRIAIWMRNFDGWADCFVHEPYLTRFGWWHIGGVFNRRGWDEISGRLRRDMIENPEPRPHLAYDTTVENLVLRVHGDMAWASFEQRYPGRPVDQFRPGLTYEFRVFERQDGKWKIAALGLLDSGAGHADEATVQLDAEGRVVWLSPTAKAALAEDDDLVIRNGKLRVRDSRTDRKLQAAVHWAAGLDSAYMSTRGAVPVLMDAGDGLPTKIWWVIVNAGLIHFSFGDNRISEQRLDVAALVYGLSPAQKQLGGLVAEGLSLNEIAGRMGITANTARTHLQRVFDKTGVRTQPALVRVLLSAAAPL
jgi:DNA-binding CsgD family transcriptional regulator